MEEIQQKWPEMALTPVGKVCSDIKSPMLMAGESDIELQDRLARADSARPILFLTGHGGVPESVAAMKAGASDFLEKPVDPDSLVTAMAVRPRRTAAARPARWRS